MIKKILATFIFFGLLFLFSCGKYEEGPKFSLLTKMNRITGTWEIDEITHNGEETDTSDEYINIEVTFVKDGTGYYDFFMSFLGSKTKIATADLSWEFTNDKEYIKTTVEEIEFNEVFLEFNFEDFGEFGELEEDFELNEDDLTEFLNIHARILRLTKKELWLEDEVEDDGEINIIVLKMTKKD